MCGHVFDDPLTLRRIEMDGRIAIFALNLVGKAKILELALVFAQKACSS
jgi:hypothetical protein